MRIAGLIVLILIVFIGVGFSALNAQPVVIKYFLGERTLPLSVAVFLGLLVGILPTGFLMSLKIWDLKRRVRRAQKHVLQLEEQLAQARELSLKDPSK